MITQLNLEFFKCFKLLKLPLGQLTLLSGSNASGKSSVLQSLVLLHQTVLEQEWSTKLLLNGSELCLGTVTDVVDKVTGRRSFGIAVLTEDRSISWTFEGTDRKDMSAIVASVTVDDVTISNPPVLRYLLPVDAKHNDAAALARRIQRLTSLTAERIGPRDIYPLEDPTACLVVGPRGEHAASLLHWGRDETVLPELVIASKPPTRLHQVEARMDQFFPGCSLELQQVPQSNAVTLGLRTSSATDFHRPVHVGFGLTQVFPIFVAALSREPGDLLLVENPEVHLHPAGQALMGTFLAEVAAAGIQVVIETHSDHVLNGVRRAVKSKLIAPQNVLIHFFKPRDGDGAQVVSPVVDHQGNLDTWPQGFFDQFDKDMNYFAEWGT